MDPLQELGYLSTFSPSGPSHRHSLIQELGEKSPSIYLTLPRSMAFFPSQDCMCWMNRGNRKAFTSHDLPLQLGHWTIYCQVLPRRQLPFREEKIRLLQLVQDTAGAEWLRCTSASEDWAVSQTINPTFSLFLPRLTCACANGDISKISFHPQLLKS